MFFVTPAAVIVFRADASIEIGNGHVARCLTLAQALAERGLRSVFACRVQAGDAVRLIEAKGYTVLKLSPAITEPESPDAAASSTESLWTDHEQAADAAETIAAAGKLAAKATWIVVDHYGLGAHWERAVAPHCGRLLVIDDLANRRHECDMLLDQNYYAGFEHRYDELVPRRCLRFLGPRHVLLRPEFRDAQNAMRERDGTVRRILIAFGSNDPGGESLKALWALQALAPAGVAIDVVAGASNPRRAELRSLCAGIEGCAYHEQIDYMARLITQADLCVGAGGATTWERCVLGLPSLTIVTAANQLRTTLDMAAAGAIEFLGESQDVHAEDISSAVAAAIENPAGNRALGLRAVTMVPAVDGAAQLAHAMDRFHKSALSGNDTPRPAGRA